MPAGAAAMMRTESADTVSSYPSSPSDAGPPRRRTIAPRGAAALPDVTGIANPVGTRSSAASISPVRVTSALPAGTATRVDDVSANGAPLPGVTDSGIGTMRWAPSEVGATKIGGRCACAFGAAAGVAAGAGLGAVVGVGRQAASTLESAMLAWTRTVDRERIIIGMPLDGGVFGGAKNCRPARSHGSLRRVSGRDALGFASRTRIHALTHSLPHQLLLEHLEPQIIPLRQAEPLVAVRKGLPRARANVAAPLVPPDQRVSHVDHGQPHPLRSALSRVRLGFGEQRAPELARLKIGADGQHAEVPDAGLLGIQPHASEQFGAGLVTQGEQHRAWCRRQLRTEKCGVGSLPADEIGFRRPPGARGVAAKTGVHQGGDVVEVGFAGDRNAHYSTPIRVNRRVADAHAFVTIAKSCHPGM